MILHFLYITCRKNSLFRGPAIEKAGRHTEKAAPGKSAARIAEKTERKNARRKAIVPLRSKVQATRRVPRNGMAARPRASADGCVGVLVQTTAPKARPLVQTRPFFIQNNSASPCRADAGAYREPALEAQRARLSTALGVTAAGPAG